MPAESPEQKTPPGPAGRRLQGSIAVAINDARMDDVRRELRPFFMTPAFLLTAAAGASILLLTFLV